MGYDDVEEEGTGLEHRLKKSLSPLVIETGNTSVCIAAVRLDKVLRQD